MTSSIDLHPEELLERDADGDLTAAERARLETHLRHCPACRMERRARVDFRRAESLPEPDTQAFLARLVLPERTRTAIAGPRRRFRRVPLAFAAAALLAIAGLAAAASSLSMRRDAKVSDGVTQARATSFAAVLPSSGRSPTPEPTETGSIAPREAPPFTVPIGPEPSGERAQSDRPGGAFARPSEPSPTARPLRPTGVAGPRPSTVEDASRLFDEASASRRNGDHEAARAAYRALIARYPSSVEARESLEALGRMLLDDGDAAGALNSFDAYLGHGGALAEEAMLGRASALQRLGRVEEERNAWATILETFPDSVHADRARRRLAAMGR
jgi:TolA-binding protein